MYPSVSSFLFYKMHTEILARLYRVEDSAYREGILVLKNKGMEKNEGRG